jgi:hypothetical protein
MLNTQQFRAEVGSRARQQAAYSAGRFNGRGPADRGIGTGKAEGDYGIGTGVAVGADATSNWADFGESGDYWRRLT